MSPLKSHLPHLLELEIALQALQPSDGIGLVPWHAAGTNMPGEPGPGLLHTLHSINMTSLLPSMNLL